MYWRSNPLVFSFDPRCAGEWGSQKVDGDVGLDGEIDMSAHLASLVPGDRLDQLGGQGANRLLHGLFD
jgi:hypothetical protein